MRRPEDKMLRALSACAPTTPTEDKDGRQDDKPRQGEVPSAIHRVVAAVVCCVPRAVSSVSSLHWYTTMTDDDDPTACAVWDAPPTTLRAAIAVLWPVRYPTASAAKKAARQGEAWLNGQRCKGRRSSTQQVQPGDTVGFQQLPPRRQREIAPTQRAPTLVVAYLDPTLAVVVKPADRKSVV